MYNGCACILPVFCSKVQVKGGWPEKINTCTFSFLSCSASEETRRVFSSSVAASVDFIYNGNATTQVEYNIQGTIQVIYCSRFACLDVTDVSMTNIWYLTLHNLILYIHCNTIHWMRARINTQSYTCVNFACIS